MRSLALGSERSGRICLRAFRVVLSAAAEAAREPERACNVRGMARTANWPHDFGEAEHLC
eukprot:2519835-Pleurochrysis_carterae.AAC.5